ncbi:hypothetical protein AVEN_102659-1 [Araneus ventricosus]|uniref:Uncharacterized protein n=1 Tax=Araneus ventricosus TaxID=182803 RepID=A0A4Y2HXS4_ARAVE|nr:hypothetical protein AVEN_102659-1 [Araneus ventricosus]
MEFGIWLYNRNCRHVLNFVPNLFHACPSVCSCVCERDNLRGRITTVLPPEKPQTPDMPVLVVMETRYSTAFGGEGKGDISFGTNRTGGSLILLCTSAENEFLALRIALSLPNVAVFYTCIPPFFDSST